MSLQYMGLQGISGSLVVLDDVKGASFDEMARITLQDGTERTGRVAMLEGDKAVLQIFEGTNGLALNNTRTTFTGHPMELPLSADLLGRVFSGAGRPLDGLGEVVPEKFGDINGQPLNPVSRKYPRDFIQTGISSID